MDMIGRKKFPLILGVDTNTHSSLYGPDTNKCGEEFEDCILSCGLYVENQGLSPTYEVN